MRPLLLRSLLAVVFPVVAGAQGYQEVDGLIVIEAEDYASQSQADIRRWIRFDSDSPAHSYADSDETHVEGASGGAYLEILPDTRTNHDEQLIHGVNFQPEPGKMCVLTYPISVSRAGRYYVWGRAFSTGPEDNGLHLGLNGEWPASGERLQFCEGKFQWTWSSQQRRPENHCGTPLTVWLDIKEPGQHTLMVSMREDGTELDKLILALDEGFIPEEMGPAPTLYQPVELPVRSQFKKITHYRQMWKVDEHFKPEQTRAVPFYLDEDTRSFAVDASKPSYREGFARASAVYKKEAREVFDLVLVTLAEIDGESSYRVLLNDELIGAFQNPETEIDYAEVYFTLRDITLAKNDVITIESRAHTNGKIPEGSGTAYSRGRWIGLVLQ